MRGKKSNINSSIKQKCQKTVKGSAVDPRVLCPNRYKTTNLTTTFPVFTLPVDDGHRAFLSTMFKELAVLFKM